MNLDIDKELEILMARYLAVDSKRKRAIDDMLRNMKFASEGRIEDLAEIAISLLFFKIKKAKSLK